MKIRTIGTLIAVGALVLGSYGPAFAETSTSSLAAIIQTLQNQLATLRAQVEAAHNAQAQVTATLGDIKATLKLASQLRAGASGEDVRLLQTVLAANPDVYPEGLITGYYGALTEKAVRRFQKLNGLDQVGIVGPKTLAKINNELEINPVSKENNDNNGQGGQLCAIVPPGHLIAPGWLRKHATPIIPPCQTLPPGILKQISTSTATADVTPPVLSQVSATGIGSSAAHITWMTDEFATSKVWYATSSPITTGTSTPTTSSFALVINHDILLSGLAANTTYYYVAASTDASGNMSMSAQFSFTTGVQADVTPPAITSVGANGITSTGAHISWSTAEPATSLVWYSSGSSVTIGVSPSVSSASLVLAHDVALTGLATSTTYYFVASSADSSLNVSTSSQLSFTTLPPPDTTPPILSIAAGINATSSIHVIWTTDEPSTSKVYFSTSTPVLTASAAVVSSNSLVTYHDVTLVPLTPNTLHHYIITSTDLSGNTATSTELTLMTLSL